MKPGKKPTTGHVMVEEKGKELKQITRATWLQVIPHNLRFSDADEDGS